jgi:hypothetical protein
VWNAAPGRLTKDELVERSGHADARAILKAVAGLNEDWGSVVLFPGATGGGYGLLV